MRLLNVESGEEMVVSLVGNEEMSFTGPALSDGHMVLSSGEGEEYVNFMLVTGMNVSPPRHVKSIGKAVVEGIFVYKIIDEYGEVSVAFVDRHKTDGWCCRCARVHSGECENILLEAPFDGEEYASVDEDSQEFGFVEELHMAGRTERMVV